MRAPLLLLCAGCVPRLYSDATSDSDVAWRAPANTWPVSEPPAGLEGQGMDEGEIVYDVRGTDQFGDETSLWQFAGSWILVDISTMWCAPCQDLARGTEDVAQTYKDRGLVYVTLLHENLLNEAPTLEDLGLWARFPEGGEGAYDLITQPIVADPKGRSGSLEAVRANQYPVVLLVGPDLRVVERIEPPQESRVIEVIEATLPPR